MQILSQAEQWPERVAAIRQSQEGPPPNPPSYPTDPLRPPSNSVGPGGTPPPEDDTGSLPPPVPVPPPGPAQPGTGSGLPPNIWGPPSETIPQIPGIFPIPAIPGLGMVPPEGTLPTAPRPTTGSVRKAMPHSTPHDTRPFTNSSDFDPRQNALDEGEFFYNRDPELGWGPPHNVGGDPPGAVSIEPPDKAGPYDARVMRKEESGLDYDAIVRRNPKGDGWDILAPLPD